MKQNGGFVWVNSEPGLGTTFKFFLLQVQSLSSEIAITKPVESSPRGLRDSAAGGRRSVRASSLPAISYSQRSHRAGSDPWRRRDPCVARAPRPDSLAGHGCSDAQNGWTELAERLTDERPDLKVLFVSGYAENTVLKHGTIDVATRFLQRPFSLKTLARKVREVLEASEASALATSSRGWGSG